MGLQYSQFVWLATLVVFHASHLVVAVAWDALLEEGFCLLGRGELVVVVFPHVRLPVADFSASALANRAAHHRLPRGVSLFTAEASLICALW